LPVEPSEVIALPDGFAVGGINGERRALWWQVHFDGDIEPLSDAALPTHPAPPPLRPDPIARIFGPRPLVTALEDGWPLEDATALVARDGGLARIRLADGLLVETVGDAFSLNPSRCHPVSLGSPRDRNAFGFVCGEPLGQTRVYAWNAGQSRMLELRRFAEPRQVLAFGNGALAVRGPCGSRQADPEGEQRWCVMSEAGVVRTANAGPRCRPRAFRGPGRRRDRPRLAARAW
jgi:hypothetical protein